jgi:hypothetical protein
VLSSHFSKSGVATQEHDLKHFGSVVFVLEYYKITRNNRANKQWLEGDVTIKQTS